MAKLKTYHIIWKDKEDSPQGLGKNYTGINEIWAHTKWRSEFPKAIFKGMMEVDSELQDRDKASYDEHVSIRAVCPLQGRRKDIMDTNNETIFSE